jgi:hypothetical protein
MREQVRAEPLVLRRAGPAAGIVATDVGIQRYEVPGAEVERVVAFGTVRARSEVVEVALGAGRFVLVVSGAG